MRNSCTAGSLTAEEAAEPEILGAVASAITKDCLASGSVRLSNVSVAVSLSGLSHKKKKKKEERERERALLSRHCVS